MTLRTIFLEVVTIKLAGDDQAVTIEFSLVQWHNDSLRREFYEAYWPISRELAKLSDREFGVLQARWIGEYVAVDGVADGAGA